MIRVLIADDHPLIRRGLRQILSETSDIVVAGEAEDCASALHRLSKKKYDVVILDISMPGRGGIDVLTRIKDKNPNLPVLILSIHPEEQYAIRAIRVGASGYLTKNCEPDELLRAVRKVASGGKYIQETVAQKLAIDISSKTSNPPHDSLSNREYEVLRKIAAGKTVSVIASEMSLSVKTISTYRTRILEKMNMRNSAELTRYCFEHNLIE
jgi:two-component system invasion response regulator UvrY